MSDEDMIRLWAFAGRIYWRGDARSAGEAAALGAVFVSRVRNARLLGSDAGRSAIDPISSGRSSSVLPM
jgi:hypothetical protein